ncbi:UvrD-helicase domain-containing protein [Colwellia sp. D2M02]|uniref:UvrD-helicase domain-containing protein n=1 Tax=Colwellia sp. D2M02 TaxID=2841562 RepID=UPI001C0A4D3E|nr:UvrD-helicase domain-containing protein [Colwellia sp. D2M02]MBU2894972.1 UvrD-helicase domain-containing protein [Colwellia sp. D2M02]
MSVITAYPSSIGNFFTYLKYAQLNDNAVVAYFKLGASKSYHFSTFVGFPQIQQSYLHSTIYLGDYNNTQIRFLKSTQAKAFSEALAKNIQPIILAKLKAIQITLKKLAFDEFLRDSSLNILAEQLLPLLNNYRNNQDVWHKNIYSESIDVFKKLLNFNTIEKLSAALRHNYEQATLQARKQFYDVIESNPLTIEQRLAVIRDNDKNLILAAAGTGKTSVMVAKALDLIDRKTTSADKILILAYNKAAASELTARFNKNTHKLANNNSPLTPHIMTFHGLARFILTQCNLPTALSIFANDANKQTSWLTLWLNQAIKQDINFFYQLLSTLYMPDNTSLAPIYLTLSGDKMRTYQEFLISNLLFINEIDFKYELLQQHGSFHLTSENIKVAFDNNKGLGRIIVLDYPNKKMINRFNQNKGFDQKSIEQQLKIIIPHLKNTDELVNQYQQNSRYKNTLIKHFTDCGLMKLAVERYQPCLQAQRTERLSPREIKTRFVHANIVNSEIHTDILVKITKAYSEELHQQKTIDFDDMINNAYDVVTQKMLIPQWSHILVDEFQDISNARYQLLDALITQGHQVKLTAVGDDWQSIYRFSGGDLTLTTQFEKLVGRYSLSKLQKTFRYNNSIAEVAGQFVMKNPEQYKKHIVTHEQVSQPQVFLHDDYTEHHNKKSYYDKALNLIKNILKRSPQASIAVIARYRFQLTSLHEKIKQQSSNSHSFLESQIFFWTYHNAKGLEADYVILLSFDNSDFGFPAKNKNDVLVEALLPSADDFPNSEERRLLYVGLTRAKYQAHIIASQENTSEFINELLSGNYNIQVASTYFNEQRSSIELM